MQRYNDGTEKGAYSRAVRKGGHILVSGTGPLTEQGELVSDDAYAQSKRVVERIIDAVEQLGGTLEDIVHVTIYVGSSSAAPGIFKAYREAFATQQPAAMVLSEVRFGRPEFHVEMDARAIVDDA